MFHLIMSSPVGVFIAVKAQHLIYAAVVISDCDECGFNDLGKLLFGGLALALLIGVGVSILFWKMKNRQTTGGGVVSIRSESGRSAKANVDSSAS
jgi:hypothetical protein